MTTQANMRATYNLPILAIRRSPCSDHRVAHAHAGPQSDNAAELKGTRKLLSIRPDIYDFEPDLDLKRRQTKPQIPGTMPTNRFRSIRTGSGVFRPRSNTLKLRDSSAETRRSEKGYRDTSMYHSSASASSTKNRATLSHLRSVANIALV